MRAIRRSKHVSDAPLVPGRRGAAVARDREVPTRQPQLVAGTAYEVEEPHFTTPLMLPELSVACVTVRAGFGEACPRRGLGLRPRARTGPGQTHAPLRNIRALDGDARIAPRCAWISRPIFASARVVMDHRNERTSSKVTEHSIAALGAWAAPHTKSTSPRRAVKRRL